MGQQSFAYWCQDVLLRCAPYPNDQVAAIQLSMRPARAVGEDPTAHVGHGAWGDPAFWPACFAIAGSRLPRSGGVRRWLLTRREKRKDPVEAAPSEASGYGSRRYHENRGLGAWQGRWHLILLSTMMSKWTTGVQDSPLERSKTGLACCSREQGSA